MAGITTPVYTDGTQTIECALVKNSDGSSIASPTYVDCVRDGNGPNGDARWICKSTAPNGDYPAQAQKMRLKGVSPEKAVFSGNAVSVTTGTTTTTTQLSAPTGLAATATSSTTVDASWNSVANASAYRLQRATDANFTQGLGIVYAGTGTSYVNTVTTGTLYYYRVLAEGSGSYTNSAYSAAVSAAATQGGTVFALIPWGDSRYGTTGGSPTLPAKVAAAFASDARIGSVTTVQHDGAGLGQPAYFGSGSLLSLISEVYAAIDSAKAAGQIPVVFIEGGINDLAIDVENGVSVANSLTKLAIAYGQAHQLLQARGAITIAVTPFAAAPASFSSAQKSALEDARLQNNTALRANYASSYHARLLDDAASDYQLDALADCANAPYADGVHLADKTPDANVAIATVTALLAGQQTGIISGRPDPATAGSPPLVSLVMRKSTGVNTATPLSASILAGTPTKVEFFSGSTSLRVFTSAPFSFNYVPTTTGAQVISVTVTDSANRTASDSANLLVTATYIDQDVTGMYLVDDGSPAITRTGNWSSSSDPLQLVGGSHSFANATGSKYGARYIMSRFKIAATQLTNGSTFDVYIKNNTSGEALRKIGSGTCYNPNTNINSAIVFDSGAFIEDDYSIEVRLTGTSGFIDLDALYYTSSVAPANQPGAGPPTSGDNVKFEAADLTLENHADNQTATGPDGQWMRWGPGNATTPVGSYTGKTLDITYFAFSDSGPVTVYATIDGVESEVGSYDGTSGNLKTITLPAGTCSRVRLFSNAAYIVRIRLH